jgi:uncharacterized protein YraI/SH3-like domain-containing protein
MRFMRLSILSLMVAALVGVLAGVATPPRTAWADEAVCSVFAQQAIEAAKAACANFGPDSACYGHGAAANDTNSNFSQQGDTVALAEVVGLNTAPADAQNSAWGLVAMRLTAGLASTEPLTEAVLYGGAMLTSKVQVAATASPTFAVKTFDELAVLLRAGASTNLPQVTRLQAGQEGIADARNAKSTWVRVRLDGLVGWANINQLRFDGDLASLPVLEDTDIFPAFLYTAPLQAFQLNTAPDAKAAKVAAKACGAASAGLLLQRGGEAKTPALFNINGAEIALSKGTLMISAVAKDNLSVMAVTGSAIVRTLGVEKELAQGQMIRVRLGGADGLTAIAQPRAAEPFGFAAVDGAATGLLSEALPCVVGLAPGDQQPAARSGPGKKEFTSLFYLQPTALYYAEGWNTDAEGNNWWKLSNKERAEHWVQQSLVRNAGTCATLKKVEPGLFESADGTAGIPGGGGFAPSAKSVWNADVTSDQMSGQCSGGALNYCSHMVALSPRGSGLSWKGQELKVYPLGKVQENVYAYNGRNGLNNGRIKMVLVFNGPSNFTMTQTVVYDADPNCQHVHVLTGAAR